MFKLADAKSSRKAINLRHGRSAKNEIGRSRSAVSYKPRYLASTTRHPCFSRSQIFRIFRTSSAVVYDHYRGTSRVLHLTLLFLSFR